MRVAVIAVLFALIISSQTFAEQVWDFDYDTAGWQAQKDILDLKAANGILSGKSSSGFPLLISPNLYFEAEDNDSLEIRLKAAGKEAVLLWIGTYDRTFNPQKQITFPVSSDSGFHTYYINLKSQNPLWDGSISRIILNPSASPGDFQIDYIKLTKGNLITNFRAGWQEFSGQKGRKVVGITINNIPNSSFLGKPATFYVYFILLLAFFPVMAKEFIKHSKETLAVKWQNIGIKTLTVLLVFWILLEINSIYNQTNILKEDSVLIGKSIEEKRAIVTGPDFYDFLIFCNEKLPPRSKYQLLISSPYHTSKAEYYLYPHTPSASAAEYILLFREKPKIDTSSFTVFAKYKEGEYILKCN